ncbi:MAG: branched-chain alpha-keto acid dehydrogenase subunit E2 [Candidatus Dadabacteria bacterium]|nr:branched-chain alpha-keto acid dehydrogenase subunit E2 [Candidatus Dadabacteria bacterium]MYA47661.1 branched-chain alpha-keto acid dehydrogenase subunit E2 [Candidatus Dadabacteria bacterium]MYF48517.1 branched-chain alpha-keto acid dehydrogenase subunit E2 [Candidatus Dadabacteria bacterium]MYG83542.1 branched-chain alpha-keto acid dehydrogenase subunit E2 [Candidatus Dadabacteria bacterium]MYK49761.1 branched-chain alpha-keto acid dehydrogenase subunit E2 [Candidatus Dadabacteria bacteri
MIEFRLPELGEGIESGQVIEVFVSPGDRVTLEQPLLEVETDKAAVEIPSPADGTIVDVCVSAGDTVEISQVLVRMNGDDESKESPKDAPTAAEEEKPAAVQAPFPEKEPEEEKKQTTSPKAAPVDDIAPSGPLAVAAAPSVRRLARELGVELSSVSGTGPRGRILERDVKAHAKAIIRSASFAPAVPEEPELPDFSRWGETVTESFSTVRKLTAERLSQAWAAPHVTQFDKADATRLEDLRKLNREKVSEAGGNLTVTAILVKALSRALSEFPKFNSSIHMGSRTIVYKKYINIGVAVDTERGLLVPVIRDVDKKDITQISVELTEISSAAREKKLSADRLKGGSFTITNLGGIGGTFFTPILNPPEVAILGVSRSSFEPAYVDGELALRFMLPLSLSYDHRIIDGAEAARFLRWLCEMLERSPESIFEGV